jgi:hypothetical protein
VGDPATEKRDLATLEADMKEFVVCHLIVREVTLAPKHQFIKFRVEIGN